MSNIHVYEITKLEYAYQRDTILNSWAVTDCKQGLSVYLFLQIQINTEATAYAVTYCLSSTHSKNLISGTFSVFTHNSHPYIS
jgi:hypothetical protein